jgi:hypothetical protein
MRRFSNFDEIIKRYGTITSGVWADEVKWMVVYRLPSYVTQLTNTATGRPCTKIYTNKDCIKPLDRAFQNLKDNKLLSELKTFDGCFMIRDIRGIPGKPSMHSYGLALDFNAKENALGQPPKLSTEFVKCFIDAGWTWGGNFSRKDGMHFEFT